MSTPKYFMFKTLVALNLGINMTLLIICPEKQSLQARVLLNLKE